MAYGARDRLIIQVQRNVCHDHKGFMGVNATVLMKKSPKYLCPVLCRFASILKSTKRVLRPARKPANWKYMHTGNPTAATAAMKP